MAAMTYFDFDLLIERRMRSYHARVVNSPAGEASVNFRLPFDEMELDEFLGSAVYGPLLLAPLSRMEDLSPQSFGERLFGAVFKEGVAECWRRSLDVAAREGAGLRLRLRLTDVPELAALPWEYLYDPDKQRFIVLSEQTPLVRYLELQATQQPLLVTRPLRILMIIANPSDYERLNVEQEWRNIQEALSALQRGGLVVIERLPEATRSALQQQLRQGEYHILHFIGHGVFDEDAGRGELLFVGNDGSADFVPASVLGTLLHDHRSLRLVLLNACEGARGGESNPFAGTGQYLIQQGLPSVIAMQSAVSDEAAIALAHEFYRALADGYPVDAALAEARKAMFGQGNQLEWAIPTLFMRAPDGQLFEIEGIGEEGPAPGSPPFKGLQYFNQNDAHLFYGREKVTAELIAHLREHRFLAIVGASGSGKSSLVRAGLIPALSRNEALEDGTFPPEGCQDWLVHIITPTNHPLEALAASLTRDVESVTATATLMDDLRQDPRSLHLYGRKLLSQKANATGLLLVADQFEELFTLCRDKAERKAFVDNLLTASERGSTIVVIALRADFYSHCSQFENLRHALETRQKYIGAMTTEELRSAIEKPAHQGKWQFEEGLIELLLEDVGEEPGALPLLSHALLETWVRRRGRLLTFAGYREAGGLKSAIACTADRVFHQNLNEQQKKIARMIFLRLTELGEGTPDTRRRVTFAELIPSEQASLSAVETVIKLLADKRLITTDASQASYEQENQYLVHVEVAHEALIREWPTLLGWLDEDREGLRIHRDLTEAALKWQKLERDPGALYRGVRLVQALEWAKTHPEVINAEENDFLNESRKLIEREKEEREAQQKRELEAAQKLAEQTEARRKAEEQRAQEAEAREEEQKRASSRLRQFAYALAVMLFVAIGIAWYAVGQQQKAEQQTRIATAGQLAAQAQSALDKFPQRSLLLAIEALNVTMRENEPRVVDAEQALRDALANTGGILLNGHKYSITEVAISPDGQWLVTGSSDTTARLWNLKEPSVPPLILAGHTGPINSLAISPNGQWLVTGSDDATARLWNLKAPQAQPVILRGHEDKINSLAISPDGQWLVTGSDDATARLWNLKAPSAGSLILAGHSGPIYAVSISPDGLWVVTGSWDNTARLWNLEAPSTPPVILRGHRDKINSLAISPDGQWLVTGSPDSTARLWDLEAPSTPPLILAGQHFQTPIVTISSDGEWLVTGTPDGAIHLWDFEALSVPPLILRGHESLILSVDISPNGQWLATGSSDGTARLWNLKVPSSLPLILRGHEEPISRVAISPDGQWLVTGSQDGTARLWDLETPFAQPVILRGHNESILSVTFSPDGLSLVTTNRHWDNGTSAYLWNLEIPSAPPLILQDNEAPISRVAISPDGQWLVTGNRDRTVRRWNLEAPSALPLILSEHEGPILDLAISPDGMWLVTTDGTAHLWNLEAPSTQPIILSGPPYIAEVAISPDGQWLVTGSIDGRARLWDLEAFSAQAVILQGHEVPRQDQDLVISPEEQWLVTGSQNGTACLRKLEAPILPPIVSEPLRSSTRHLAISSDGQWLVTGSWNGTACLWDLETPSTQSVILQGQEGPIQDMVISPDGESLVTTSGNDGAARLWVLKTPSVSPLILRGHEGDILTLAISPDGQWLVTGSDNGTAGLWDLKAPSASPIILRGHEAQILTMAISPDGHSLVTGSYDNTARLWNLRRSELLVLACRTAGRNFTQEEWKQYFGEERYRQTCEEFPHHYTIIDAITEEGRNLAQKGHIDEAKTLFNEALALAPNLELEPEAEAKKLAVEALIEDGTVLARESAIEQAIAKFSQALALAPKLELEPEAEAKKLATQALVKDGRALAREGAIEQAIAKFTEAKALDPNLALEPEAEAKKLAAQALVEDGRALARKGAIEQAIAKFTEAKALGPNLALAPEAYAKKLAAQALIAHGKELASTGAIEQALAKFTEAKALDPYLALEPELEAKKLAPGALILNGRELARDGAIEQALAKFAEVQTIYSEVEIKARDWDTLCRYGSLWGQAALVMDTCEYVVELDPNNGEIRDSRGLARALVGNYAGAIEDFQFYIEWAINDGFVLEYRIGQREEWIYYLSQGRDPFDPETVEELKKEYMNRPGIGLPRQDLGGSRDTGVEIWH